MCERAGILLPAILAAVLSLNVSTSFADSKSPVGSATVVGSEIKSRFDLPAEPLDKALRDFAVQANCNISYEPSLVSGLQAPAIKGEFTVRNVLSLMLTGTRLRAVNVNEDTIQILKESDSTSPDAGATQRNTSSTGTDVIRVAAAAPDAQAPATPSPASDSTNSTTTDEKTRDNKDLDEIVVTGSHIRGVSTASPVIEIGREEIDRSGYTSIADLMQSLPQNFGGGYSAASVVNNSAVNLGYADNPAAASVPNLRGLGPGSTLTLVDGHRMASGLAGGGADISSIPIDAIERIEVITDSASAIYGSDAVAGVVNVILKRNYEGAETSLSYGLAPDGGGTEKRASQLFGTKWGGGDLLIAYEHMQQDAVDARDRGFTSAALEPNSLLPETQSNSLTLSATQDLSTKISLFVDGLYVARDADHFTSEPFFIAPSEYPTTLRKYAVAAGLNFNLFRDWKATLFINEAEDETEDDSIYLTAPSATPATAERLLGTMRSVEANANGGVATLPSGVVRLAVGAGYREEGFSDSLGITSTSLTNEAEGDRNIRYAFGELSIPLVEHSQRAGLNYLDLVVSGRNERYSDFGEKTVPKVGLVYAPTSSVKLRSTWGKAYRAPNLFDLDGVPILELVDLANPASSTGSSTVLFRAGGNPNLRPETADAWSIGADYSSPELSNLQVSTTFFNIKYTNRISSIPNFFTALTDPLNSFFVTPSPSASLAQSVYDSYPPSNVFNETSSPFNPGGIGAIVDGRVVNVATQTARGADLSINYKMGAGSSSELLFLNGTYLDLSQQNTPQSAEQTLSGLAFYPPKFRLRGGATWKWNSWALTGTVNYLPRETNNQVIPFQSVASWTTVDTSLRFAPDLSGVLSGLHFSLAVLNVFNRAPPFVLLPATETQGLTYDSSNTSPLGRFVNLQVSKQW
jgi:iron complex outermembrane recepter protein